MKVISKMIYLMEKDIIYIKCQDRNIKENIKMD